MQEANETSLSRRIRWLIGKIDHSYRRMEGMLMNIGFIGAGKVGFSMGKYLTERGMRVTGYYSRSPQSSLEAARFTDTGQYFDLRRLAEDSDAIFLTVPDGVIPAVWDELKVLPIQNKMILHCSGML
ncbi:MAG: NAD(P)-binding domain-containing protein, partial [Clostridiales bacterium]|nr:NAD(P)-binding domain-containing protein [Clostridiales bacterium]